MVAREVVEYGHGLQRIGSSIMNVCWVCRRSRFRVLLLPCGLLLIIVLIRNLLLAHSKSSVVHLESKRNTHVSTLDKQRKGPFHENNGNIYGPAFVNQPLEGDQVREKLATKSPTRVPKRLEPTQTHVIPAIAPRPKSKPKHVPAPAEESDFRAHKYCSGLFKEKNGHPRQTYTKGIVQRQVPEPEADVQPKVAEAIETIDISNDDRLALQARHTEPQWIKKTLRYFSDTQYRKNCTRSYQDEDRWGFHTESFCMKDDTQVYFGMFGKRRCYHLGVDEEGTRRARTDPFCVCLPDWHGKHCSIPDVIFDGGYPNEYGVGIHTPPRRIIYAFPFSGEFDMLEATMQSVYKAVDVFLILESNYSAAGDPRERELLSRLCEGYLGQMQEKVVYISLDYFPVEARADGWVIDALLRNKIGTVAFGSVLENVRDDDLVISLDADEVISPETLFFLKLHYGYPEPFGFTLRHSVYGYFWRAPDEVTNAFGGCRVALLKDILHGQLYDVRNAPKNIDRDRRRLDKFKRRTATRIKPWIAGSKDVPAGWHCSWCFLPQGIRNKLLSAHASDFPRWGSIPDKTELTFIAKLVEKGLWFDEKTLLERRHSLQYGFAPPYILENSEKYQHLLNLTYYNLQSKLLQKSHS